MHELSIALSLVELAAEAAANAGAERVEAVHLRVGALAGVVPEALQFSFAIAARGTPLEDAQLAIEALPTVIFCACCDADRALPTPGSFRCPVCGTPSAAIRQGRELELVALTLAEPAPAASGP